MGGEDGWRKGEEAEEEREKKKMQKKVGDTAQGYRYKKENEKKEGKRKSTRLREKCRWDQAFNPFTLAITFSPPSPLYHPLLTPFLRPATHQSIYVVSRTGRLACLPP